MIRAVLFDLDGTLADTAPDLNYAINQMREARSLPPVPLSATRPVTSMGARGLLAVGFNITPEGHGYEALRSEFLDLYAANICRETKLFPEMAELLNELDHRGLLWGIVTNKPERYTQPLLQALGLSTRAACIIGGDTTAHPKPHPAPLLAAAERLGVTPSDCIYVGDDHRDVEAARAAQMQVVVAGFGYLNGTDPQTCGADAIIRTPLQLLPYIAP